ncbi:MAG: hypothetical protein PHO04_02385 [Candidatus Pacebacteria bacterium]|jgi:hypothetical protein|nr:hypothetical protein [Candidatus Paceibacterota bacterium]NMB47724.1 hypothetical protein [Patescibacteria group bacterium]MDD2796746.1 hypothetical protein [Candidatus Paceibacterota bacterium]MDD3048139.1 hypothetical protein [Candidatus Paceibacterota bacterium]MDD3510155.1 hypothetical protein [Candidatus Paceibacterota bacterium]
MASNKAPTQNFIPIERIRDGILVLNNQSLRGILIVSSLNFGLKSADEQTAIIYQFQNFLNSLDFQTQILVISRRINMTGYIDRLKDVESKQTNDLLKLQTTEYIKFIEEIIGGGSIMTKNFYVTVPYFPLTELTSFIPDEDSKKKEPLTEQKFQAAKYQLYQRMEYVALGLRRCGLKSAPLKNAEIIELLWANYHPQEAEYGYYPDIPPELTK